MKAINLNFRKEAKKERNKNTAKDLYWYKGLNTYGKPIASRQMVKSIDNANAL